MQRFPLHFRPPCRKRHLRISKNILEDIRVVGGQINWYFQIFSDILRYIAKRLGAFLLAVLAASSQATSKNIKEYFRRYKGCCCTHILRSRIYVNSFQQTLQFPWIDWRIQNESLPHSKCVPYSNELQSIDNQTITHFKTNCRLISHRKILQFASNHLLICTISSRFLTQITVSSASSCNA